MSIVQRRGLVLPDIKLYCKVMVIKACDSGPGVVKMTKGTEERTLKQI